MKRMLLLLAVMTHAKTQDSDGYTNENRPYKFAFNIEGYEHRSEEKDEKGIIKGEYGFVTGDGIYHKTVYATDENGNFKIISMKNYYIGLPNDSTTNAPTKIITTTTQATTPEQTHIIRKLDGIPGCGGCLVPTSTTRSRTTRSEEVHGIDVRLGHEVSTQKNINMGSPKVKPSTNKPFLSRNVPTKGITSSQFGQNQQKSKSTTVTPEISKTLTPKQLLNKLKESNPHKTQVENHRDSGKIQKINPSLHRDSFTLQSHDQSGLLYEFNQTQTFQGHHETGYIDSTKEGNYFVNGRDGVQQIVKYIANNSGYQPLIQFKKIVASETPNPDTEKLHNVLKGAYFKWFYKK